MSDVPSAGSRWLRWTGPGATFVLALLCLVLGALWLLGEYGERSAEVTRPTAVDPVVSAEGRQQTLEVSGELVAQLLSYDWQGVAQQAERLRPLLTTSAAEEYAERIEGVRRQVEDDRTTLRAEVREVGVVSAGPSRGVALVYLDQLSTTQGSPGERRDQVRVLVTVTRDGEEWRVSRFDVF